jgi:hypothetical protein
VLVVLLGVPLLVVVDPSLHVVVVTGVVVVVVTVVVPTKPSVKFPVVVGRFTETELVFELELDVDTLLLVLVPTIVGPQSAQTLPDVPGLAGVDPGA